MNEARMACSIRAFLHPDTYPAPCVYRRCFHMYREKRTAVPEVRYGGRCVLCGALRHPKK